MKFKKKIILSVIFMFSIFIGINKVYAAVPVAVTIKNNPGYMTVGSKYKLNAEVYPSNSGDKTVKWKSSNVKVVTVDSQGNIKAEGEGSAQITASTINGKTTSITITVKNARGTESKTVDSNLKIEKCPNFILVGNTDSIRVIGGKKVKFKSDDTSVLTVDKSGNLNAKKVGSATITATASNGRTVSKTIDVIAMKFNESDIKIPKRGSKDVSVTIEAPTSFNPILYGSFDWRRASTSYLKIIKPKDFNKTFKYNLVVGANSKEDRIFYTFETKLRGLNKSGNTNIYFVVSDDSSEAGIKQNVEILDTTNDFTIQCPSFTYSKDMRKITISPNTSLTNQIQVEYAYGYKTGSNANWSFSSFYSGNKKFDIIVPENISQVRLEVFGKNGNVRSCYSIPLRYDYSDEENDKMTFNDNISCPKFKTTKTTQGLAPVWDDLGTIHHSGVTSLKLENSLEEADKTHYSKYQYNWFVYDGSVGDKWRNYYYTFNYKRNDSINMKYNRDVRGNLLTIDENGDIKKCFTDIYDNFNFAKKDEIDGINIYYEAGYTGAEKVASLIKKVPSNLKIATKNIFYFTPNTWESHNYGGGGWTFAAISSIRMYGSLDEYYLYATVHEMGHNLDGAYAVLSDKSVVEQEDAKEKFLKYWNMYKIKTNNTYDNSKKKCPNKFYKKSDFKDDDSDHSKYYDWYYSCIEFDYLRNYTYDEDYPRSEFFADLIEYTYTNSIRNETNELQPVNDELIKFKDKYVKKMWDNRSKILEIRNAKG